MIILLVLTSSDWVDRLLQELPLSLRRIIAQTIQVTPPTALGKTFEQD